VDTVIVITPEEQQDALDEGEDIVVVEVDIVTITIPLEAIEALTEAAAEAEEEFEYLYLQIVVHPPTEAPPVEGDEEPAVFELEVELSLTQGETVITELDAPIQIQVDLSEFALEGVDPVRLVAILEDGTLVLGEMDAQSGIFTFETTTVGDFRVMYIPTLRIIGLAIGGYDIVDLLADEMLLVMEDMTPVIQDDRTLIPLRFVANALDAEVSWNDATREVTIVRGAQSLTFAIGEMAPGMDVPARIMNNRTMVPIRFISEFFEAEVRWLPDTQEVWIIQR
jgi:hypothetical protein